MGILYGMINRKSQKVPTEYLTSLKNALHFNNPHKITEWSEKNYAGGIIHETSIPDIDTCSSDQLFFSFCGRIDNRKELSLKLGLIKDAEDISDCQLVRNAFKKWGKECTNYLLGDWIFICFNSETNECFIARDHSGISSVYYFLNSDYFVYCSSLKGILALPFVDRSVNELKLAATLTTWRSHSSNTSYRFIQSLPGGHSLTLGKELKVVSYWTTGECGLLSLKREDEYYESFREIFTEAVKCRLDNKKSAGVSLSSGLDSGAIAGIAANEWAKENKEILSFTSAPAFDNADKIPATKNPDESKLVESYSKKYKNIRIEILRSQNASILDSLYTIIDIFNEPIPNPSNFYWMNDIYEKAKQANLDVLFSGQGGNFTISWPSTQFIEKMREPKMPVWKWSNLASFRNFRKNILKPVTPAPLISFYSKILYGDKPWLDASMISPSFADRIGLKQQILNSGWYPPRYQKTHMHDAQEFLLSPQTYPYGYFYSSINHYFGFTNVDPTLDKRVIEFCLSLPDHIFLSEKESRRLVRTGLRQSLPEEILMSKKRGLQAADIIPRMHQQKERWLSFKEELNQSDFAKEYLDVKKMIDFINQVASLKTIPHTDAHKFLRAASMFVFLKSL